MSEVKKNTYRIVWEQAESGEEILSSEIDAVITGDTVMEYISVLTQFHSTFRPSPPPVRRILEVKLVRENW